MKQEVEDFLTNLIKENNAEIPEFAFTASDYVKKMQEMGIEPPDISTIYRRLNRMTSRGLLIKVKINPSLVYYCEKKYEKLVSLDEDAIMKA